MGSYGAALRTKTPDLELVVGKITGTGAALPTINAGMDFDGGPVLARSGVGVFTLTFSPGTREVYPQPPAFWATTPANVDGWNVVFGEYDPTTRVLAMNLYTEAVAGTAVDLAAATGMYLTFLVRSTTLRGGK